MSREVWKVVETEAGKIGVAKTKGRRSKGRSRKEMRREGGKMEVEKETEKGKNNGSKKSGRGMGSVEQRERGGKVRRKS